MDQKFPKCTPVNIPEELKLMERFCLWRYEAVPGRKDIGKIPYNPVTLKRCLPNNPATFSSFDKAVQTQGQGFDGLGVGLFGDLGAIDIDHCIGSDGKISEMASSIIRIMDSYTEVSPSGTGIRIMFYAPGMDYDKKLYYSKDSKTGLELYIGSMDTRYVTITGNALHARPVETRTDEALYVLHTYLKRPSDASVTASSNSVGADVPKASSTSEAVSAPSVASQNPVARISDADLIEIAKHGKNGEKFSRLWAGDVCTYNNGDHSSADAALCSMLAFYTNNDKARMDSLFRQSGLMRDKWQDRQDYRNNTLQYAMDHTSKFYDPLRVFTAVPVGANAAGDPPASSAQTPQEETAEVLNSSAAALMDGFLAEVQKNRSQRAISTGFKALDEKLGGGLYPGLYFIGAVSSLGKTSLMLQMADQIASSGQHVLFFSLEMSKWQLMAKSISRLTYSVCIDQRLDRKYAKTTRGILNGSGECQMSATEVDVIKRAQGIYKSRIAGNIWFHEGIGNIGVKEIREEVEKHIRATGISPVVIVDYVQIIAPAEVRASDKQNTDKNVLELKRMSRDLSIPVIGISSLNRENYYQPISMTAFKESGSLEYGSDVLIGLQHAGMDDIARMKKDSEKAEALNKIKNRNEENAAKGEPIGIELKILKNRNGCKATVGFGFVSMFNSFVELPIGFTVVEDDYKSL